MEGFDTECVVTILDEDKPGNIGFKERFRTVKRKDDVVYVELERTDGSDGAIKCVANTVNDVEKLPGKRQAEENVDFIPLHNVPVEFGNNVVSVRLKIEMPDCEEKDDED